MQTTMNDLILENYRKAMEYLRHTDEMIHRVVHEIENNPMCSCCLTPVVDTEPQRQPLYMRSTFSEKIETEMTNEDFPMNLLPADLFGDNLDHIGEAQHRYYTELENMKTPPVSPRKSSPPKLVYKNKKVKK
jgi:hypothetical protein